MILDITYTVCVIVVFYGLFSITLSSVFYIYKNMSKRIMAILSCIAIGLLTTSIVL